MNANTLTVYDQFHDPQSGVQLLGTAIARSQMFGCESEHQGVVLAMECFARRIPPLMLQEKYHLIKGKLSMKAEAMLAEFNERGGKHRIIERSGNRAAIEVTLDGKTDTFSLTWEEAQQEPFVYNGKESEIIKAIAKGDKSKLELKPKYATPRSRTQMLWARVVSDAIGAVMPSVRRGSYSPEELEDVAETNEAESKPARSNGKPKAAAATTATVQPATATAQQPGEVIDGEFTVKEPPKAEEPTGLASREQCRKITELFCRLQLSSEAIDKILAKRGVKATQSLKAEQAEEIIANLRKKVEQAEAAADAATNYIAGQSRSNPSDEVITPATPCSEQQINAIKAALAEMKQIAPNCVKDVAAKLQQSGKERLSDLSSRDADLLLGDIGRRNLDAFFDRSLETWQPVEQPSESVVDNHDDHIDMNQPSETADADVPFDVPTESSQPA
jgi:hypothetical protein